MLKSFLIFKRNGAHLVKKRTIKTKKLRIVHFRGLSILNMQKHFWFISSFEHVSFIVNETYSKKKWQSKSLCFLYVIFQTYKNVVLSNVHSLGWLLWLWFYPICVNGKKISTYSHCWFSQWGCYLVSLLAIHHNHYVINELCWFFTTLIKICPLELKTYIFNLCKHYKKSLFFLLGILVKKIASYGFFVPMFNLTKVPFWTNRFGFNHFD